MFIPHVLDVLVNQFLTTLRALEVFVFPAVLILSAHFHAAYPLVLALSLLTTVVAGELLFLNIVFGFHVILHVIHRIIIFVRINLYSQNGQDFHFRIHYCEYDIGSGIYFPM